MREHDETENGTVWQKIHEVDNRVTVLETKVDRTDKIIAAVVDKHSVLTITLERLTAVFEKFLERFDEYIITAEKTRVEHESKLESATKFQTVVKSVWQTIVIIAIVFSGVAGAVYTVSENAGVVVHLHKSGE